MKLKSLRRSQSRQGTWAPVKSLFMNLRRRLASLSLKGDWAAPCPPPPQGPTPCLLGLATTGARRRRSGRRQGWRRLGSLHPSLFSVKPLRLLRPWTDAIAGEPGRWRFPVRVWTYPAPPCPDLSLANI